MEEFLSNPVAKALLTVASVDALVVLTVLQCRLLKEFFKKNYQTGKKMFVPTFRRYYENNKCMQTKSHPIVLFFFFSDHVTVSG